MKLRAFVLHLARADKRRPNAQDLLQNCGLKGEIWPAVDGADLSSDDLTAPLGTRLFAPPYPFRLNPGEIGCFLSHRIIWAEMQNRNLDAALIIEDDARLDRDVFSTALDLAMRHIETLGYIQFQTRHSKGPVHLVDKTGPCALIVPQRTGLRTTAQLISREAAARLDAQSRIIDRPVDTFVQSHWHTGLRPAMIYPSGVREISDRLEGSTIQGARKPISGEFRRFTSRVRYRFAMSRLSRRSPAPVEGGSDD